MKREDKLESELFHVGLAFLAIGIGGWVLYSLLLWDKLPRIPCMMLTLFDVYCPGCGGTRAIKALLEGKFLMALWYHPLIPYTAVIAGGFMLTQGLSRLGIKRVKGWKYHSWYLYGAIMLIAINFFVKNVLRLVWGISM